MLSIVFDNYEPNTEQFTESQHKIKLPENPYIFYFFIAPALFAVKVRAGAFCFFDYQFIMENIDILPN